MPHIIDLNEYRSHGAKVYAGRERGLAAREKAGIDQMDAGTEPVEIRIPEDVFSVNSSFFIGMFGASIKKLGEAEFRRRFVFSGPGVDRALDDAIREALRTSSPLTRPSRSEQ